MNPVSYPRLPRRWQGNTSSPARLTRRFAWLAGTCLLVSLLLGACSNRTQLSESIENLTFRTLSGDKLSIRDATGPMLINFWSTTCSICLVEMPHMAELYLDYTGKGLQLVAVAVPYDPPNRVLELAEASGWPFPVALDVAGEALEAFGTVKGTPTSYLLSADGQLVKRYTGAIDFDELRGELDALLASG